MKHRLKSIDWLAFQNNVTIVILVLATFVLGSMVTAYILGQRSTQVIVNDEEYGRQCIATIPFWHSEKPIDLGCVKVSK
jgi:hypothetical protein